MSFFKFTLVLTTLLALIFSAVALPAAPAPGSLLGRSYTRRSAESASSAVQLAARVATEDSEEFATRSERFQRRLLTRRLGSMSRQDLQKREPTEPEVDSVARRSPSPEPATFKVVRLIAATNSGPGALH